MLEELYLRKIGDHYEIFFKDLRDDTLPVHLEYPFKEAAVVIVYPDGVIDAIRVSKNDEFHMEYYHSLMVKSKRFARAILDSGVTVDWKDYHTFPLNCAFINNGMVVFNNMNIEEIRQNKDLFFSNGGDSSFWCYYPPQSVRTQSVSTFIDIIEKNYKNKSVVNAEEIGYLEEDSGSLKDRRI